MAAPFAYMFGGLLFQSGFPLSDLCPLQHIGNGIEPDIFLEYSDQPPVERTGDLIYRWQGRYKLVLEAHGRDWLLRGDAGIMMLISGCGTRALCHCPDSSTSPLFLSIMVRRILPRLCALHNRLVLHAASLVGDTGAIVVFGGSGSGKSTLTTALARSLDWSILADDMPIFRDLSSENAGTIPHACKSLPGVSLWRRSKEAVGPDDRYCEIIPGYQDKYWCVPPRKGGAEQAPVRAIFCIGLPSTDRAIEWKQLSGADPMVIAASQMVLFNPASKQEREQGMAQVKSLIETVPTYAISYPRDFAALPMVAQTIRNICDTLPHADL